ncbi:hypothetical protein [Fluviicola sp.]|uniref:hypothetical protein n=1 Tax=Fluviicola sp. TaxID=1917219 RepID=UPI0031D3EF52
MNIRLILFALSSLVVLSCAKTRVCECSDGYHIEMTSAKKQAEQACEKLSAGEVSCKLN